MTEQRNIILLSIDALRADHLSYHGYHRETSSFLDDLANRGTCFMNAFSASSHTREAIPALITGRYPSKFARNGYRLVGQSIATMLSGREFKTGAFHSNPYISRAYGYDEGFDTFYDDLTLGKNRFVALAERALNKFVLNKGAYHARASEINQRSLDWLESVESDEPFFLWNHYMDVHGPYNPPDGYSVYADRSVSDSEAQDLYQKCINQPDVITEQERELLIDLYDGEIRYIDTKLSAFFEALNDRGLLEESLVIITADHGDAFGEHGYYTHPRQVYNDLLAVPLIVLGDSTSPGRIETTASTLDVVPTALHAIGAEIGSLSGQSLFSLLKSNGDGVHRKVISSAQGENENASIRRFAIQDGQFKYMLERNTETGTVKRRRAFDCERDPGEHDPLSAQSLPERVVELRSRLEEYSKRVVRDIDNVTDGHGDMSREVEQRLEHLGYK